MLLLLLQLLVVLTQVGGIDALLRLGDSTNRDRGHHEQELHCCASCCCCCCFNCSITSLHFVTVRESQRARPTPSHKSICDVCEPKLHFYIEPRRLAERQLVAALSLSLSLSIGEVEALGSLFFDLQQLLLAYERVHAVQLLLLLLLLFLYL